MLNLKVLGKIKTGSVGRNPLEYENGLADGQKAHKGKPQSHFRSLRKKFSEASGLTGTKLNAYLTGFLIGWNRYKKPSK